MAKASISRAWEESRAIISRDGKILSAVALALLVLPGLIADLFMPRPEAGGMPSPGTWIIPFTISLVIAMVGQLAIIRIAGGAETTVGGAIAHALRRAPVLLAAMILWVAPFAIVAVAMGGALGPGDRPSPGLALLVVVVTLAMTVGGLILFVRMMMSGPVASNEAVGPAGVLKRSWELTRGNWLRLFGFFILFTIAGAVILMFVGIVGGLLGRLISGDPAPMTVGGLLLSILSQVAGAAISVVFSVMLARIYAQLAAGRDNVREVFE